MEDVDRQFYIAYNKLTGCLDWGDYGGEGLSDSHTI
jgi:hypothetical protein